MTKEEINNLNDEFHKNHDSEQGIYTQPSMIPIHIKEPVLYMRYKTGGIDGGNCYEEYHDPRPFYNDKKPKFEILDFVLNKLKPNISYLDYKRIEKLIHMQEDSEYLYYGNQDDYKITYIILSELEELLANVNN